ncbi:MAG: hypothetical protein EXR79_13875 [Myxococcales bacterium]|nr:hypothetical protein [Myxococcales bacterium]
MHRPATHLAPLALAALQFGSACSSPSPHTTPAGATGGKLPDGATFGDSAAATTKDSDATTANDTGLTDLSDGTPADTGPAGACTEGEALCHTATVAKVCVNGQFELKAKCPDSQLCVQGTCATPVDCKPGESKGCDGYTTELVCAADGKAIVPKKCKAPQQCAAGTCRDVVCTPGIAECAEQTTFKTCLDDGQGFSQPTKCKPGSVCFGGKCLSQCETNVKVTGNVGCEYWSADLDNYPDPFSAKQPDLIPHSIVISNPGQFDATITFELRGHCKGGAQCKPEGKCLQGHCGDEASAAPYKLALPNPVVKAGATVEFKMPVMNCDGSGIWHKGIHVLADQPIVAWQFNPFNGEGAASNDGSLLLPQHVLGKSYFAVTRPSGIAFMGFKAQHGYFTVIAASKGTTKVTVTPTANVAAVAALGIPALKKGQSWTATLEMGQVLSLESEGELSLQGPADLTGSFIDADKPIAVFGGHEETLETYEGGPKESCCAEHIEEQLLPLEAWGKDALCVKTKPRGVEKDIWFIMAGESGTTVKTTPSIKDLDGKTFAKPGNWVRIETEQSFMLEATGKVQVVQMIVSQQQTDDFIGDTTMMVVPPKAEFRDNYQVLTAQGYDKNYGSVVRKLGAKVSLDGNPIAAGEFQPFGDGTWERGYVKFKEGPHAFEGDQPFGLMVYGYGNATAYGYPGGIQLK